MFCLRVMFPMCRFSASVLMGGEHVPEYPLHPDRLFMAGVSGYGHNDCDQEIREALEWIEQLDPPCICAPPAVSETHDVFVPLADCGKDNPFKRAKRSKTIMSTPISDPIYMEWTNAELPERLIQPMKKLCKSIVKLGSSPVIVSVSQEAPSPNWFPVKEGGFMKLRVPRPGRLTQLVDAYGTGGQDRLPVPLSDSEWYINHKPESSTVIQSPFDSEMIIFKRVGGVILDSNAAMAVSDAMRKMVVNHASSGRKDGWPNEMSRIVLSGHEADGKATKHTHAAYISLPFVGMEHADATIKGVGIVLPKLSTSDRLSCLALLSNALFGKNNESFQLDIPGVGQLELSYCDDGKWTTDARQWNSASRIWESVTPIAIERYPKNDVDMLNAIDSVCQMGGMPKLMSAAFNRYSFVRKAQGCSAFTPYSKGNKHRVMIHAKLEFEYPVKGPVLLGAGRYCGLGLCRSASYQEEGNKC